MTTVAEALGAKTPLGSDLAAGLEQLDLNQTVTFTKYIRLILPVDGSAFWIRADLVSNSAEFNAARFNAARLDQAPKITVPAPYITAQGSLHYATDIRQLEEETIPVKRVVFTSEHEVNDLNAVGPMQIYIATVGTVRFAFSSRGLFYRQADLYHYVGEAIYSDMESQIIDDVRSFNSRDVVVSNSLPAWLSLNGYVPIYPTFGNPSIPLFPSFLVPQNLPPPYAAVHVMPDRTQAIAATQLVSSTSSLSQLTEDTVRITLFGVRNDQALDFVACVNQYSLDYDMFGVMNMPTIRDEKRTQAELNVIAMKKTVEFRISYYQRRMQNLARQLITSAVPSFIIGDLAA
jgi:hypothetical protein